MLPKLFSVVGILLVCHFSQTTASDTVQLDSGNINNIISTHELVMVNFYADWCRFSQILAPVFDETAKKVKEMYPEAGKVAFGRVDCEKEGGIATTYHISKYPTLKMFRNGHVVKKEYRGQRSADAISQFIRSQLEDTIRQHEHLDEINELNNAKRNMIGYFVSKDSDAYKTFRRVSMQLRDDCVFHAVTGTEAEALIAERPGAEAKLVFRPPNTRSEDLSYTGETGDYDFMLDWMMDKCVPLVREITFENAEELTEEGLPFLILFHKLDDTEIVNLFTKAVTDELLSEKSAVNFLVADGSKFTHPLHHLGKSPNDLPVLAIDSFRHMYLFKHDLQTGLQTPGLLKQFVADLHSGKLHREFHHGPDPTEAPKLEGAQAGGSKHIPHAIEEGEEGKIEQPTSPPESAFKKLSPSENRYSILRQRDEL